MGLRVPQNQIVTSKYTTGGEYLVESTYKNYQGYYYEYNDVTYAGKEFNIKSPILIKKGSDDVNKLLLNPKTAQYAAISGIKINDNKINSLPKLNTTINSDKGGELFLAFYYKKKNENPIIIRAISEESYLALQNEPIYQTTYVGTYQGKTKSIDEADREMPGLKIFLLEINRTPNFISSNTSLIPTSSKSITQPQPQPQLTGSVTDTPKPQDIIPVGPIFINPTPIPPPPDPTPTAPILSNLSIKPDSITNNSFGITFNVDSTGNSTLNRVGTSYNTLPGFSYTNALDTGDTYLGFYLQNRTGLNPETFYYYFAYAMNDAGFTGSVGENTFWTLSNPPTAQASNLVAVTGSSTEIRLSWTPATFPGSGATTKRYLLLRAIFPNIPNILNSSGQIPFEDANTTIQSSNISSLSSSYTASGLTTNTTYTFKLIPYTWDGANGATYNYLTANAPTASAELTTPPATCNADTWNIGDLYTDNEDNPIGYIYYINACKLYVLGVDDLLAIDSITETQVDPQWGCADTTILSGGGDTSIGGGRGNTEIIIIANCDPTFIVPFAAQACYNYNDIIRGYNWGLPTIGDWQQMYDIKAILVAAGAIEDKYYWSSNEDGKLNAVAANPTSGTAGTVSKLSGRKTSNYPVRPVTIIETPRAR
jgi:hypothetical protein